MFNIVYGFAHIQNDMFRISSLTRFVHARPKNRFMKSVPYTFFFSYRLTSYSYILYFISVVSINCPRKFRNRFTFVQIKAIFSFTDNLFNWMPKLNGIWLLKIDRQSKLLCVPFKRCDSRFCNYVFKCTQQFTQNNVYFGCDWYGFSMLQNANKSSNFSPSFDFVLNTHTKSTQNNPSHKSFQ